MRHRRAIHLPLPAFLVTTVWLLSSPAQAQQMFQACYVPTVGLIYLIQETGLPTTCLDSTHTPVNWTSGGAATVADGSITTLKLADSSVTAAKLDTNAVTTNAIKDGAVTAADLAAGAVDSPAIAPNAIVLAKMADGSVGSAEVINNSLTADDLADDAVTRAKLAPGIGVVSTTNNLSDFLEFHDNSGSTSTASTRTLVDVTGAGVLVNGMVYGYLMEDVAGSGNLYTVQIQVDGATPFTYPAGSSSGMRTLPSLTARAEDRAGGDVGIILLPPIHFDTSLRVTYYHTGANSTAVVGYALVKMDP